jgi:hypothetical protein
MKINDYILYFIIIILFIIFFNFGFSEGKISVIENYKIECKVLTTTECYFIKK